MASVTQAEAKLGSSKEMAAKSGVVGFLISLHDLSSLELMMQTKANIFMSQFAVCRVVMIVMVFTFAK